MLASQKVPCQGRCYARIQRHEGEFSWQSTLPYTSRRSRNCTHDHQSLCNEERTREQSEHYISCEQLRASLPVSTSVPCSSRNFQHVIAHRDHTLPDACIDHVDLFSYLHWSAKQAKKSVKAFRHTGQRNVRISSTMCIRARVTASAAFARAAAARAAASAA